MVEDMKQDLFWEASELAVLEVMYLNHDEGIHNVAWFAKDDERPVVSRFSVRIP